MAGLADGSEAAIAARRTVQKALSNRKTGISAGMPEACLLGAKPCRLFYESVVRVKWCWVPLAFVPLAGAART
jgi:hypothetical protein